MTVHIQTSPASNLVLALLCPSLLNRQPSGLEYGPVVLVEQMVTVGDVISKCSDRVHYVRYGARDYTFCL